MSSELMNEQEMRDAKVPDIKTAEELSAYIETLVNRKHDYGTAVYAMSMAATAAFNYIAHRLGVTGFQASCADLDVLRRTRMIDGPFMLSVAENMLYPQYDLEQGLKEFMESEDVRRWLKEEARKKIEKAKGQQVHERVMERWQMWAGGE